MKYLKTRTIAIALLTSCITFHVQAADINGNDQTNNSSTTTASSECNSSGSTAYNTPIGKIVSVSCDSKDQASLDGMKLNGNLFWRGIHSPTPAYSYTNKKNDLTYYQVYSTPKEANRDCPSYALFLDYTSDKPIVFKIGVSNACAEISEEPVWVPSVEQTDAGMKSDYAGGVKVSSDNVTITLGGDSGSPKLVFVYDMKKHQFTHLPKIDPDNLPVVDHSTHPDGSPLSDQELSELADGMKPFANKVSP
jgi:hypothetical protein